jgi:hypothetical protein
MATFLWFCSWQSWRGGERWCLATLVFTAVCAVAVTPCYPCPRTLLVVVLLARFSPPRNQYPPRLRFSDRPLLPLSASPSLSLPPSVCLCLSVCVSRVSLARSLSLSLSVSISISISVSITVSLCLSACSLPVSLSLCRFAAAQQHPLVPPPILPRRAASDARGIPHRSSHGCAEPLQRLLQVQAPQ